MNFLKQVRSNKVKETRIVRFWLKYRKTIAVAASIAGITALAVSRITSYYAPRTPNTQLQDLSRKISELAKCQKTINDKLNKLQSKGPALQKLKSREVPDL